MLRSRVLLRRPVLCAYLRDEADSNCNRASSQYRRSLDLRVVVSFDTISTTAGAEIQSAVDAGALQIISPHRVLHTATNPRPVAAQTPLRPRQNSRVDNGRRSLP